MADAGVWSRRDRPPAGSVMIDHFGKARNTAVVHVWRRYSNIAQCWRPELADVFAPLRELVQPGVRSRVGKVASNVVQARVQKRNPRRTASVIPESAVQVPASVALKTGR